MKNQLLISEWVCGIVRDMQIQWLGLGAFKIQTSRAVIITDPFVDQVGAALPKLKADIVLVSDAESKLANNTQRLSGEPFIITGPGEYEAHDVFVYGISATHSIYLLETEGMSVAFLGSTANIITAKQLEVIEGVDILLLPLTTFSSEQRTTLLSEIEPRVVIPYLYTSTTELAPFIKEVGAKDSEPQDKFTIKAKDLPQDTTTTIILQPIK